MTERFTDPIGLAAVPPAPPELIEEAVRDALVEVDALAASAALMAPLADAERAAVMRIADDLLMGAPGAAESAPVYVRDEGAVVTLPGADYFVPYAGAHVSPVSAWTRMRGVERLGKAKSRDGPGALAKAREPGNELPPDDDERRVHEADLSDAAHAALLRQYAQLEPLLTDPDADLMGAGLWEELDRVMEDAARPALERAALSAAGAAAGQLEITPDWGLVNNEALFQARLRASQLARETGQTTRAGIVAAVADWIEAGEDYAGLKRRAAAVLGVKPWERNAQARALRSRAEMIAVTENTRVYAEANRAVWAAVPGVQSYKIKTAADGLVCPICRSRRGEVYPITDEANLPPFHPRCRCWIVPVLAEAQPAVPEPEPVAPAVSAAPEAEETWWYIPSTQAREAYNKIMGLDEAVAAEEARLRKERADIYRDNDKVLKALMSAKPGSKRYQELEAKADAYGERVRELSREIANERLLRRRLAWDIVRVPDPAKLDLSIHAGTGGGQLSPERSAEARRALEEAQQLISRRIVSRDTVVVVRDDRPADKARSHFIAEKPESKARMGWLVMDDHSGADVYAHELGHGLDTDPAVMRRAYNYLRQRTDGETARKMSDLTGNPAYDAWELAKPDMFVDLYGRPQPYCGKIYNDANGKPYATEITSMGLEYMFHDPVRFAQEDKEYWMWTYDTLRGEEGR